MNEETPSASDSTAKRLKEAGYTPLRQAILFCLIVAAVGGVMGSIFLAIAFNALFGMETESFNSIAGMVVGGLVAGGIALAKIQQGNREAREKIEDADWRKLLHNLHQRPGLESRGSRPGRS
jgi:hypothetical protein